MTEVGAGSVVVRTLVTFSTTTQQSLFLSKLVAFPSLAYASLAPEYGPSRSVLAEAEPTPYNGVYVNSGGGKTDNPGGAADTMNGALAGTCKPAMPKLRIGRVEFGWEMR